jgi:phage tail sheath protein FI
MLDYKAPGVYIQELPAPGPIAGVGTSTAAFIGPALRGDLNEPAKITNWTQFRDRYGGFLTAPRRYLAYAVRGFFENGGTVAWIVRVSTAKRAVLELKDRGTGSAQGNALLVRAAQGGTDGNSIKVEARDASIVGPNTARVRKVSAPLASAAGSTITLQSAADAARFRPGDVVMIEGGNQRVQVTRVRGADLVLASDLSAGATSGTVRIADLTANQRTFRVEGGTGVEPGSVLHLAQGSTAEDAVVDVVTGELVTLGGDGLTKAYKLGDSDAAVEVTTSEFTLVMTSPAGDETYEKLSMDPRHSRYFSRVVTSPLIEVRLPDTPGTQRPPANRPKVAAAASLTLGEADDLTKISSGHYLAALEKLAKVDDVSLVCVPDATDPTVQGAVVAHCETLGDRFAILDSAPNAGLGGSGSILEQRAAVESSRGHAALYYPWIRVNDPAGATGDETLLVPPSGHLAGVFARSDEQRGVHKAPANELLNGVVGLQATLDDVEQGELNVEGVNVLRTFPGRARPLVWGARTTAPTSATAWRYVNVRRLFLFIEESIQEGIRWAVFEPNDLGLWKRLDRTISEFLTRVWASGALFGATPDEAFYVKVDAENNPPALRELGQVVIEVGIAPVRPAEFVVVRIGMWAGGAEVTEA